MHVNWWKNLPEATFAMAVSFMEIACVIVTKENSQQKPLYGGKQMIVILKQTMKIKMENVSFAYTFAGELE